MSQKKCCGNCGLFEQDEENPNIGLCHRDPPTDSVRTIDCYPNVGIALICGSWRPLSWRDLPDDTAPKNPKTRQKPSKALTSGAELIPDQPSPKDVLTLWDSIYGALTKTPYTKGSRTGEAANAAKLVKAIAAQDRDWSRIEKAMRKFHADSWARGQDFNVFVQKFSKYDGEKDLPSAGGF